MHVHLRKLSLADTGPIDLIAQRMRATLVEVEGAEAGEAMYSMDWLRERVRWHLDPANSPARVIVAEAPGGEIVAHTICRVEAGHPAEVDDVDEALEAPGRLGFISTTYVAPEHRRHGIAAQLLAGAERWFLELGLRRSTTWTSATNAPLIRLYERQGYQVAEQAPNEVTGTAMVRLERRFPL